MQQPPSFGVNCCTPTYPRHFKDLLQRMLSLCEAGLSLPQDYRDHYMQFLAYKQRQNKYGK
jgi:hypothetical protein